ncbi:uncharacterized protein LOC126985578 [Eriocheir sinensis]|uniref:uncharacterized protein LOC126985578 n=1 Tax=Eriocheir sinensis TaxID=95602 RepID=UPI0021C67557|nr:uncharacterized protein LOC126985578 [Eriocheir sinensis]
MQSHVGNRCSRVLVVVLVTLAACFTPAPAQIHWNRGWGAGGSMGKRFPSSVASSSPSVAGGRGDLGTEEAGFMTAVDCSADLTHAYNLLLKIIESEATRIAACELRSETAAASSVAGEHEDHPARVLPWWKASTTDQ